MVGVLERVTFHSTTYQVVENAGQEFWEALDVAVWCNSLGFRIRQLMFTRPSEPSPLGTSNATPTIQALTESESDVVNDDIAVAKEGMASSSATAPAQCKKKH